MRGASALEQVLAAERERPVRAFVVWEPVLWTDLGPPSSRRLASVSDARASQYWDPGRLVSALVTSMPWAAREGLAHGDGPRGELIAWDLVLLFPPGSCGGEALPEPAFHGEPAVSRMAEAQERLRALLAR